MSFHETVDKLSKELDLSPKIIEKVYRLYWQYVKNIIQELPLKEDLDKGTFSNLKTSINIPSLGKFSVTYDRYIGCKKRLSYIKTNRKNRLNNDTNK